MTQPYWNPPDPTPPEQIEEIPCSNPNCNHGWDEEMNDVCEECYGAGHNDQAEIDPRPRRLLTKRESVGR
jgi:hypothetical protein